jgi:nicotinic acetylcholine receptor
MQFRGNYTLKWMIIVSSFLTIGIQANPDAKRLYDDLLSNYNRLIRPVMNNTDTILVKLGLRLSQLIDLVSFQCVRA